MVSVGLTAVLLILTLFAGYLYYQNRYLVKDIIKNKEIESMKESFLATLVHDLKTPTNAQLNTLNLLRNEAFGKLNSRQQEMITLTQESCKYMSNLIGTIMETYNYDAGTIHLVKSKFDVVKLIENLCEEADILAQNNKLKIVFENNLFDSAIYADKLQIERVINNLLSNAINYSFADTVVRVIVNQDKDSINVSVVNISKPIPEQELQTIFDKYKKTKFSHFNKTSTGLGLYLSKRVIELHNGKIYAKSFADGKCVFGFIIPINSASEVKSSKQDMMTT